MSSIINKFMRRYSAHYSSKLMIYFSRLIIDSVLDCTTFLINLLFFSTHFFFMRIQDVEEKVQKTFPTPIDKVNNFNTFSFEQHIIKKNYHFSYSGHSPMLEKRLINQRERNVSFP